MDKDENTIVNIDEHLQCGLFVLDNLVFVQQK